MTRASPPVQAFLKINAIHMVLGALLLVAALSINDLMKHVLRLKDGEESTGRLFWYAAGVCTVALGTSFAAAKYWGVHQNDLTTLEEAA